MYCLTPTATNVITVTWFSQTDQRDWGKDLIRPAAVDITKMVSDTGLLFGPAGHRLVSR
jgi:hypothetical protein